jgi:hypothetical protein
MIDMLLLLEVFQNLILKKKLNSKVKNSILTMLVKILKQELDLMKLEEVQKKMVFMIPLQKEYQMMYI